MRIRSVSEYTKEDGAVINTALMAKDIAEDIEKGMSKDEIIGQLISAFVTLHYLPSPLTFNRD